MSNPTLRVGLATADECLWGRVCDTFADIPAFHIRWLHPERHEPWKAIAHASHLVLADEATGATINKELQAAIGPPPPQVIRFDQRGRVLDRDALKGTPEGWQLLASHCAAQRRAWVERGKAMGLAYSLYRMRQELNVAQAELQASLGGEEDSQSLRDAHLRVSQRLEQIDQSLQPSFNGSEGDGLDLRWLLADEQDIRVRPQANPRLPRMVASAAGLRRLFLSWTRRSGPVDGALLDIAAQQVDPWLLKVRVQADSKPVALGWAAGDLCRAVDQSGALAADMCHEPKVRMDLWFATMEPAAA